MAPLLTFLEPGEQDVFPNKIFSDYDQDLDKEYRYEIFWSSLLLIIKGIVGVFFGLDVHQWVSTNGVVRAWCHFVSSLAINPG